MSIQLLKKYSSPVFALGGLFLICLIVFYQPLFSGEIANATDILTQSYFWNVFIKESLFTDPCFKTWLPYVNAGTPFNGGLDNVFRPVAFLTLLLLPVHIAINYEMVLYFFLLGVFMYFYMREVGVSSLSAFFAALFLMLNGEIVSLMNAGHVNKIGAIFPVTLVFWAFERALKRKTLSAFVLAGVALGFQFWQGHVQISFYICIAILIYYVVRAGILYRQHRNIRQISRLTVFALLMVVIFLLLSAVHFLPMISFAQVSERSQGVSYEFATSWSMPPEELITYLIPGFFGLRRLNTGDDEEIVPYWGRMPFTQTGRYFGLLPVLFLLLALCFVRNKHILTLAILALVILLLGMGRYIPIYKLLYEHAPGFNMFRAPQMILFLFAFATSGLAGFGAEWFLSNFSEAKDKRLRLFLIVCILIFLFSWLITILLPQFKPTLLSQFHEALFRKGGTPEIAAARFQNIFRGFLQFNVFFGMALFILGLRLVKHIRIRWIVAALILVYLIDIGLFNEKYIDTIPIEDSHYVSENDAIRYFKDHPGLYRILELTSTPMGYGISNKYLYHHLFSVSGYEAVGVQYYNEYLQNMALGTSLVDLLNIKYLILPKNIEFEDGQTVEVGKTIGPYKIVMDADTVLLENLNYLPRVFPVHNAYVIKTRDEIFSTLLNPAFNPREAVILEEVPNVPMLSETVPSSQSKAEITSYLNRTIQIKVSMATEGFLVLSEKYYQGWKAYINGWQTKIYKANYTLQAIYLPKGEHVVTFAYQPTQFILGLGITIMTVIGLLGIFLYKKKFQGRTLTAIQTKSALISQRVSEVCHSRRLLLGIILWGIVLHIAQYGRNHSLSVDEVATALSFINKSFLELLQPLGNEISAPIGFLLIEKFFVQLFGDSEYVLRLFPFLTRILALLLFYRIARYFIKPIAVPVAFGLFVFSERLISFSSVVKQYSSDVFFALLIYAVALHLREKGVTTFRIILLGVTGALVIWCSYPVVFVLAGAGLSLAFFYLTQKDWKTIFRLSTAYVLWLLSFIALCLFSLRYLNNDAYLTPLSERNFMPFPPLSFTEITVIVKAAIDYIGYAIGWSYAIFNTVYSHSLFVLIKAIFQQVTSEGEPLLNVVGFSLFGLTWTLLYVIAIYLFLIGCFRLFSRNKEQFLFVVTPICFTFLASGIFKLPLRHRLVLHLIPLLILLIVEGFVHISEKIKPRFPLIGIVLAVILCVYPIESTTYSRLIRRGIPDQHIRPVIQYLKEHKQEGDLIYVYYAAQNLFTYYSKRLDLITDNSIVGIASRDNWDNYARDLHQLRGHKRVWILFSHFFGYEEYFFLSYLDSLGTRRDAFVGKNTAVYLYDFSRHEGS